MSHHHQHSKFGIQGLAQSKTDMQAWQLALRGFADLTQNLLRGYHKEKSSCDHRKPVTIDILHKCVASPTHTASSQFLSSIFESLAFTCFHALLHIGELTSKSSAIPILKAQDIIFKFMDSAVPYAFVLWISEYKHSKGRDISWNVLKCSNYTLKLWIMAPRKFLRYLCWGSVDKCTLTVNKLLLCFCPLKLHTL